MHKLFSYALAGALVLSSALVTAQVADQGGPPSWHSATPQQRAAMLRKIHTGFVLELGEILDLDTSSTVKLSERLQPFDDQRIQLRLENADAVGQLRQAAREGTNLQNAAALARKVAQNRIQLAQIDQAELEEIFKGVPADKVAKIAVFASDYPRRVERMAHDIHREQWMKQHGPGPSDE